MLGSVHSPDTSDDHLRHLLDQRTARADPHGLYSALSEISDTPSVYSRAFFSPRPSERPHPDLLSNDFPFKSPTLPPHRRLLDDPAASMLDLDEDVRSSMALSELYDQDDEDDRKTLEGEDGVPLPRMSYLGPKMRFHSRAPWELEDETLQEVDEAETGSQGHFANIFTGGRGKASFKSGSSSSPRPSNASRPSGESNYSHINPKRSFDTTNSHISYPRGALYALAQESLSTSSLGRPPSSTRQEGLRGKFSLSRLRSHSPNVFTPSSPSSSVTRLPHNDTPSNGPPSPRASYDTTSSTLDAQALPTFNSRQQSSPHVGGGMHPYANPDLVISYATEPPPPKSPLRSVSRSSGVFHNDSPIKVPENSSSPLPKSMAKSTLAPEPPVSLAKKRASHVQGKDISLPVSARNSLGQQGDYNQEPVPPIPLAANSIPGWTDRRPLNPGFSLISLEEARAQRSRTITAHVQSPLDSASSGESSTTTTLHNAAQETSTTLASATESNQSHDTYLRSRARSISTGAKAKNALQSFVGQPKPERRDSEPALHPAAFPGKDTAGGKTLKHKKSGFMRLFGNSGKGGEKDERAVPLSQPPPVPAIPDAHTPSKLNKLSPHRIPVPSLSPSLLNVALSQNGPTDDSSAQHPSRPGSNPKRTPPPPLSIDTGSSTIPSLPDSSFRGTKGGIPQSAPPQTSDFPALKLRPVSALFSAHFVDHIVTSELNNNEETPNTEKERPRQDSLASGSLSSGPSSASTASFAESQFSLSPVASSYVSAATTSTTPATGGFASPVTPGSWSQSTKLFGVEQQSALSQAKSDTTPTLTPYTAGIKDPEAASIIKTLQERLDSSKKAWQRRVWDLENQVRILKGEVAGLKTRCAIECEGSYCEACGRGSEPIDAARTRNVQHYGSGAVMGPRARTGSKSSKLANVQP